MAPTRDKNAGKTGAGQNAQGATFEEAMQYYCDRGDVTEVLNLFDKNAKDADLVNRMIGQPEGTPLHHAAMKGHLQLTQRLLEKKADVNSSAYEGGVAPLHLVAEEDHAELVFELITAKGNINMQDATGQTPLHRAAQAGSSTAMKVLLEMGANAQVADITGNMPLHKAAFAGRKSCVPPILKHCPEAVNMPGAEAWTALHLAAASAKPKMAEIILDGGADQNSMDDARMTPLHRAAAMGCGETCRLLLQRKANPGAEDASRWTPLHYACEYGREAAVKALLEFKADAGTSVEPSCLSPLHVAAGENHVHVCHLLMQAKADPKACSAGVTSALQLARKDPNATSELVALFEMGRYVR